jgi:hypothetical protein
MRCFLRAAEIAAHPKLVERRTRRFEGVVMRFAPDGSYSNAIPEPRARDLISAS